MAKEDEKEKKDGDETVEVPVKVLADIQKNMSEMERKMADMEAKNAGLEELFAKEVEASGDGDKNKLRTKKSFEPKFRTVRLRSYPIKGDIENKGYVIGWSNRGAYQEVDRTGLTPQIVDFIDVVFLGHERNKEGKLQAEKVKLLDLMNTGEQVFCKILEIKKEPQTIPTGEEIDITVFDPAHGLVATGEKIDGYITYDEIKYKLDIPGEKEPVWVDGIYVNA